MSFQVNPAGGHHAPPGRTGITPAAPALRASGVFRGQRVTVLVSGLPQAKTPLLTSLDEHKAFTRPSSTHVPPDSKPAVPRTADVRQLSRCDPAAARLPSHAATTRLQDARAQTFLLDHGVAKLTGTASASVRNDILRQVLRAARGAHPVEDIARALAQHLQAQQPPTPNWEGLLLQALVHRHARSQDAAELGLFSAALRGIASAIEPDRTTPSPEFLARVFACILRCHTAARPADRVPESAVHHLVSEMVRELCRRVREPRMPVAELAPWDRHPSGADRPPRSPHEMGQAVKELVRALKGSRLQPALLSTVVLTITRMAANLSWQQLVAMGCGYVLGQAGPAPDGAAWDRLGAQVRRLIQTHPQGNPLPEDFVFGLKAALDPVAAWDEANAGFGPESRIDLILIAMELAREHQAGTPVDLIERLASTDALSAREAALRAEAMMAVLEADPADALELPHLEQTALFTGQCLRLVMGAYADASRAADGGSVAVRLHRALGRLFDLACAHRLDASIADRAAFASTWSAALASWPERIAAPLRARLAPLMPPPPAQPQSPGPTGH